MKTLLTVAKLAASFVGTVALSFLLCSCGGASSDGAGQQHALSQTRMAGGVQESQKASTDNYQNAVQELYVAYFGRPADPTGLQNFENALLAAGAPTDIAGLTAAYSTNAAVRTLIDSFGTSKESQTLYGHGSSSDFVTAVFQNVLGRAPQAAGLSYWSGAIDSGALSEGNAALSIMAGALANTTAQGLLDGQLILNRLSVASYFTSQVSAQNAVVDYAGATAAGSARTMLSQVNAGTNTSSFEANVSSTVSSIVSATVLVTGTAATGEALAGATITLTDSNGATRVTVSSADGSYTINVTGLVAPFVLIASGSQQHTTASYTGSYSGTFTGSVSGSFNLNMTAQGLSSSCTISLSGGQYACKAAALASGALSITGTSPGAGVVLQGAVTGGCSSVSGTWSDSALGYSGSFTGSGTCAGAAKVKLVSVMAALGNSSSNVVNLTPLTTAIAAQLSTTGVATDLSASTDKANITANLASIDSAMQLSIASLMAQYNVSGSPISTPLVADGAGFDALYDNVVVGTFPKSASGGVNVFIGPVATQNGCYVNVAGTGCVTYSDPGTQTTTNPNLCGFDIASGAGIACDPSQPISSQPSVTLPQITGDGGIAISGPGIQFGTPAGTTLSAQQCAALSASVSGLLGSTPSPYTTSWGSLISLVQSDVAQADAGCALAGISCGGVDSAGASVIALLTTYENTYGNQFWGNQCSQ